MQEGPRGAISFLHFCLHSCLQRSISPSLEGIFKGEKPMSLTTFLQQCLTGISLGGAYALIAIGYTMVYGILRLVFFVKRGLYYDIEFAIILKICVQMASEGSNYSFF